MGMKSAVYFLAFMNVVFGLVIATHTEPAPVPGGSGGFTVSCECDEWKRAAKRCEGSLRTQVEVTALCLDGWDAHQRIDKRLGCGVGLPRGDR